MMRRYAAVVDPKLRQAPRLSLATRDGNRCGSPRKGAHRSDPFKVEIAGSNPAGVTNKF
jgi:hypothetical protein